jgi:hypothetical protein
MAGTFLRGGVELSEIITRWPTNIQSEILGFLEQFFW